MFQDETLLKSEMNDNNVINDFEINESFTVSIICKNLFKKLFLMTMTESHYSFIKESHSIFSFSQHKT